MHRHALIECAGARPTVARFESGCVSSQSSGVYIRSAFDELRARSVLQWEPQSRPLFQHRASKSRRKDEKSCFQVRLVPQTRRHLTLYRGLLSPGILRGRLRNRFCRTSRSLSSPLEYWLSFGLEKAPSTTGRNEQSDRHLRVRLAPACRSALKPCCKVSSPRRGTTAW